MKFGIHTFVWTSGKDQRDIEDVMERTRKAGYDVIEFPGLDRREFDLDALAKRAQDLGLTIAASAGLSPDLDVTSADPAVVQRGEAFLNEAVSVARDLGSRQMSGPISSAHQKYATLPTQRGWDTSVGVIRRVAERAKAAGVALNLEIVNRFETNLLNSVDQGLAYIRDTGSDNLFLHVDTFHMNIEEPNPAEAIRRAGRHLGYFHVGDSHRGFLGAGRIDFEAIFDALLDIGYDGTVTVEALNPKALGDRLSVICAVWREVWSDGDLFARESRSFIEARLREARLRAARPAA